MKSSCALWADGVMSIRLGMRNVLVNEDIMN